MFQYLDNQTQAQLSAALTAGGFNKVGFAIVGPDSHYSTGSVTMLLRSAVDTGVGYRTPIASIAAAKTYIAGLFTTFTLTPKFDFAVIDDGQGKQYTATDVAGWGA